MMEGFISVGAAVIGVVGSLLSGIVLLRLGRADRERAHAARLLEGMLSRYTGFEAKDIEREKQWTLWRGSVDQRIADSNARLASHEEECRNRWAKLLQEHGEILGVVRRLERLEERRMEIIEKDIRISRRGET